MVEPQVDISPKLSIAEMPPDFTLTASELDQWTEAGSIQGPRSSSHMFREYRTFTTLSEIIKVNPIRPDNTDIVFYGCSDGREIASTLAIFRDNNLPFTDWHIKGFDLNGSVLNPSGEFTLNIRDKLAVTHSGHDMDSLFSTHDDHSYTLRSPLYEAYRRVSLAQGNIVTDNGTLDTNQFHIVVARNMFYQNVNMIPDVMSRLSH